MTAACMMEQWMWMVSLKGGGATPAPGTRHKVGLGSGLRMKVPTFSVYV
jgi:hypothetical protein